MNEKKGRGGGGESGSSFFFYVRGADWVYKNFINTGGDAKSIASFCRSMDKP